MKVIKGALAVFFLIVALFFVGVAALTFFDAEEETQPIPSLDEPAVTPDEVQEPADQLPSSAPSPEEVPLGEAVEALHNDPDLSAISKADAVISLARDRSASLSREEVEDYSEVVVANFQNRSIVTNPDKLFLLQQVYLGASLNYAFEEGSTGQGVGFDYMQIARDLYRDTATVEDNFIQANLYQIEKALSN